MTSNFENNLFGKINIKLYTNLSKRVTSYVQPYLPGFTTERALASIAIILTTKKVIEVIQARIAHGRLMEQAQRKRANRDRQILDEFTPALEIPEEIQALVLSSNATELVQLLNQSKVTSEQVLRVYHNRAISIGVRLELIADSNFTEALHLARQYDILRERTPFEERHKLGSMFGLPICIKDSLQQKGLDATVGLAKYINALNEEDGAVVKALRAQGAIPFVRTNVSQGLALFENVNNIWGRSLNPWNELRSTGGSSGGDAGLVASQCSPIGIGTDFYGSIRIPCSFCGVSGFKPTFGRCVAFGETQASSYDLFKKLFLRANVGPIAKCVDDLVLVLRGMITQENRVYDPSSPYLPWREEPFQSKERLRIGYILTEDFFAAAVPCRRAVKEAIDSLQKQGHELIEVRIPNFNTMALHVLNILFIEGQARRHLDALGDEIAGPELRMLITIARLPSFVKRLIRPFLGKRLQVILDRTFDRKHEELVTIVAKIFEIQNQFLNFWSEWKLDAIITPASPLPAFKHGLGGKLLAAGCYAWLANLNNLPAGVVPVTKVQPGEDVYTQQDSVYVGDAIFKASQECMQGSVGLPVGVQVLTLPWEDEKCLAVMKVIENGVKFHELPTHH